MITGKDVIRKAFAKGISTGVFGYGFLFKIENVNDLVEINPFEGASNRTSFFTATKGKETTYPVQYTKYEKKRSIGAFAELSEACLLYTSDAADE